MQLNLRILLGAGIITAYTWLAAYELWRGRNEPLLITMAYDPRIGCLR